VRLLAVCMQGYPSTKDVIEIAGSLYSAVKSVLILNLQLVQALLPSTSHKAPLKLPAESFFSLQMT